MQQIYSWTPMPKCDFNKVAKLSNFIEITLRDWCSSVNLLYFFRTPFPKNTSEGLLLNVIKSSTHFYFSSAGTFQFQLHFLKCHYFMWTRLKVFLQVLFFASLLQNWYPSGITFNKGDENLTIFVRINAHKKF